MIETWVLVISIFSNSLFLDFNVVTPHIFWSFEECAKNEIFLDTEQMSMSAQCVLEQDLENFKTLEEEFGPYITID